MISVGYRLTDDVFDAPQEPIADVDPKMRLNGIQTINGEQKAIINRIQLNRSAVVELLRVESPSRIWVRLQNHITENTLTFREPFDLVPLKQVRIDDYALAPNDERSFRRCRIVEESTVGERLVKIFFIDDAVVCWVRRECLAEMPEHFMFFPWQAILVSMVGVYPMNDGDGETWTFEICDHLRGVLQEFQLLKVKVVLSSVVFNDYAKPIPVRVFGINEETDNDEVDVVAFLKRNTMLSLITDEVHDAAAHEVFEVRDDADSEPCIPLEMHSKWPVGWKGTEDLEDENRPVDLHTLTPDVESEEWNPRVNIIQMPTVEQLRASFTFPETGRKAKIMLAVEGRCTKSPYEWYARPIAKTGRNKQGDIVVWNENEQLQEVDKVDWMLDGNQKLLAFAEQLDTYYSNPKNRKPLNADEIKRMHREKRQVFAVCAVNEEKAMYTGEWQRVLIINCDDFAEVRFLDSGGRDMVLTGSLYRIHEQHCRQPPMCLQLSMHGVAPKKERSNKKWNVKEISHFKMCLREDVPIFIDIDDLAPMNPPTTDDPRPYMSPHVLLARNVKYQDESKSLIERFVDSDDGCAARSENQPVPWTH